MSNTTNALPLVISLRFLTEQGIIGSRRTMFRQVAAGDFPKPDSRVGNKLVWRRATIERHLERAGLM